MSDLADPLLPQVRWYFEALLAGDATAHDAVNWSHEQLDAEAWRDEVTFQGLMRLADLVAVRWDYARDDPDAHSRLFRSYWDWMEIVRWYDDDPAGWKENHYRRAIMSFKERFGSERARRAAAPLVTSGEVEGDEVGRWLHPDG